MKEREKPSILYIMGVLFIILISLIVTGNGPSIYKSITTDNEPKHKEQTEKVNNKKETIKRLYKNAFNEKR